MNATPTFLENLVLLLVEAQAKGPARRFFIEEYEVMNAETAATQIHVTVGVRTEPRLADEVAMEGLLMVLSWVPGEAIMAAVVMIDFGRNTEINDRLTSLVWAANEHNLYADISVSTAAMGQDEKSRYISGHISWGLHLPVPVRQNSGLMEWLVPLVDANYQKLCDEALKLREEFLQAEADVTESVSDDVGEAPTKAHGAEPPKPSGDTAPRPTGEVLPPGYRLH